MGSAQNAIWRTQWIEAADSTREKAAILSTVLHSGLSIFTNFFCLPVYECFRDEHRISQTTIVRSEFSSTPGFISDDTTRIINTIATIRSTRLGQPNHDRLVPSTLPHSGIGRPGRFASSSAFLSSLRECLPFHIAAILKLHVMRIVSSKLVVLSLVDFKCMFVCIWHPALEGHRRDAPVQLYIFSVEVCPSPVSSLWSRHSLYDI